MEAAEGFAKRVEDEGFWLSKFQEYAIVAERKATLIRKLPEHSRGNVAMVRHQVELTKFYLDGVMNAAEQIDRINQEAK